MNPLLREQSRLAPAVGLAQRALLAQPALVVVVRPLCAEPSVILSETSCSRVLVCCLGRGATLLRWRLRASAFCWSACGRSVGCMAARSLCRAGHDGWLSVGLNLASGQWDRASAAVAASARGSLLRAPLRGHLRRSVMIEQRLFMLKMVCGMLIDA
jgi:hypothetical protein